jgi:hypothetical protein
LRTAPWRLPTERRLGARPYDDRRVVLYANDPHSASIAAPCPARGFEATDRASVGAGGDGVGLCDTEAARGAAMAADDILSYLRDTVDRIFDIGDNRTDVCTAIPPRSSPHSSIRTLV